LPLTNLQLFFILKKLHESKEQWIEAAEANLLCTPAICDKNLHIPNVWQYSIFNLWRDPNRSSWLMYLAKSNLQVSLRKMTVEEIILFSERFLESPIMIKIGGLKEGQKIHPLSLDTTISDKSVFSKKNTLQCNTLHSHHYY